MRIAFSMPYFSRSRGVEGAAAAVADELVRRAETVDLYAGKIEDPPGSFTVHKLKTIPFPESLLMLSTHRSQRSIPRNEYSCIHAHNGGTLFDVLTLQSCHAAGMIRRSGAEKRKGIGLYDRIALRIEREAIESAKRTGSPIIAVSEGMKSELGDHYQIEESQIRVIPNGLDLQRFSPPDEFQRRDSRSIHRLPEDATVAVFLGNDFERKGLSIAISAVASLEKVHLLVAGRGNARAYRKRIRDLNVIDRIHFIGVPADVRKIFYAADVFVSPTSYESFSIAAYEAAACGLPVLSSDVSGVRELIVTGTPGKLLPREISAYAENIPLFATHEISSVAPAERLKQFSLPAIVSQIQIIYQSVQANR